MLMIQTKDISKIYNKNTTAKVEALKQVDLSIAKGELIAIVGKSGSGKSTLLHILGLLDSPTQGNYYLNGMDTSKVDVDELAVIRNETIGFVLQEFGLLLSKTVYENISIPLYFSKTVKRKQMPELIRNSLRQVGLEEKENSIVAELSGGQKQRVAIARAIVNNPDIILADEPTGALDQNTSQEIMNLLIELNQKGKTVVIITHDRKIASQCQRNIEITDGYVVEKCCDLQK